MDSMDIMDRTDGDPKARERLQLCPRGGVESGGIETVTVVEVDERGKAWVINAVAAEAREPLGWGFVRATFVAGGSEAGFELVVFSVEAGPGEFLLGSVGGRDAFFAEE